VNWFWHALWICLVIIPATILWGYSVFDIVFRRHDMVWWKRVLWLVLVIIIPIIGAVFYAAGSFASHEETDYGAEVDDVDGLRSQGILSDTELATQRDRIAGQEWR
jgi:hypothetical protein